MIGRRDFIKATTMACIGLSLPHGLIHIPESAAAVAKVDLAVAVGSSPANITAAAINAMGGIGKFISRGDIVVVKLNMGWDRKPEYAATTHPDVVKAIVEECLAAGAKKVKVFDNTCNDARRSYEKCGIPGALKGMKNVEVRMPAG